MNKVELIGRLTKDPELRYTTDQTAVCNFNVAIDRIPKDKGADFPGIKVFGKQAENCEKYLKKGRLVAIQGRLQTGSYTDKNGNTVYTTDVAANRVEFVDWGDQQEQKHSYNAAGKSVVWYVSTAEFAFFKYFHRHGMQERCEQIIRDQIRFSMTDEYYMVERFHEDNPWFIPWSPNASANGRLISMLITYYK